jgi:hypothetical protein
MSRRAEQLFGITLLSCVGFAIACTSFGASSPHFEAPPDAGTTNDAASNDRDAGCVGTVAFGEAFGTALDQQWTIHGPDAELDLTTGAKENGSLVLDVPANTTSTWIERALGSPCRLHVELKVRVDQLGNGDLTIVTVDDGAVVPMGIALTILDRTPVIEGPDLSGKIAGYPVDAGSAGAWDSLQLDIDFVARTWSGSIASAKHLGVLPATWTVRPLIMKIGAFRLKNADARWTLHVDDVESF